MRYDTNSEIHYSVTFRSMQTSITFASHQSFSIQLFPLDCGDLHSADGRRANATALRRQRAQSIMKLGYRCRILSSAITISSQETYSAPEMRLHFCVVPLVQAIVHSVRRPSNRSCHPAGSTIRGLHTRGAGFAIHCLCSASCVDGRMVQECKSSLPLTAEVL